MKLFGSETSPYVRKARVLIAEKKLDVEFVKVDATASDSPVPALNPLGKVPVLVRDDGSALYDSPVIVEYLDSLKTPALLAPAGEARWAMLRWEALADGVLDATVARLLESRRPAGQQSAEVIAREERRVARALDWAETQVPDGPYLMDERFTIADLVMGVALDYVDFRYAHDWRARCIRLARWHEAIRSRPAFVQTRAPGMK
jgi:glutathione S-transferase